jgi:hypothetical protein
MYETFDRIEQLDKATVTNQAVKAISDLSIKTNLETYQPPFVLHSSSSLLIRPEPLLQAAGNQTGTRGDIWASGGDPRMATLRILDCSGMYPLSLLIGMHHFLFPV